MPHLLHWASAVAEQCGKRVCCNMAHNHSSHNQGMLHTCGDSEPCEPAAKGLGGCCCCASAAATGFGGAGCCASGAAKGLAGSCASEPNGLGPMTAPLNPAGTCPPAAGARLGSDQRPDTDAAADSPPEAAAAMPL